MKILVLSDSHSGMRLMRESIRKIRPDCIIHLGDYYEDGEIIAEENPNIRIYQVPGNCDRYRCPIGAREILIMNIGGLKFYMTHGHRHNVKMTDVRLLADALEAEADVVLYGHTHMADLRWESGMWIMNPGSCGAMGGTCGLIEIADNAIQGCRILGAGNLEEFV